MKKIISALSAVLLCCSVFSCSNSPSSSVYSPSSKTSSLSSKSSNVEGMDIRRVSIIAESVLREDVPNNNLKGSGAEAITINGTTSHHLVSDKISTSVFSAPTRYVYYINGNGEYHRPEATFEYYYCYNKDEKYINGYEKNTYTQGRTDLNTYYSFLSGLSEMLVDEYDPRQANEAGVIINEYKPNVVEIELWLDKAEDPEEDDTKILKGYLLTDEQYARLISRFEEIRQAVEAANNERSD